MTAVGASGDAAPLPGLDATPAPRPPVTGPLPGDLTAPAIAPDGTALTGAGAAAQAAPGGGGFDPNELAISIAAARLKAAAGGAPEPAPATEPPRIPSPAEGILDGMTPSQRAAFEALPPEQQHAYVRVHYEVTTPKARTLLALMLEQGKLAAKGADGRTLLEAIDRFARTELSVPRGEDLVAYHQRALTTLVTQIGDPRTIDQGNAYNTCGATIVQYEFARTRPADYATFVTGLMSTRGESRLPNDPLGVSVERVPDSLSRTNPKDDRSDLSRIVQAALMNASAGYYSSRHDNTGITLPGDIRLGAAGLSGTLMTNLLNRIRQDDVAVLPRASLFTALDGGLSHGVNPGEVMDGLQQEIATQREAGRKPVLVPTCFDIGDNELHWVQVSRVTDERVYFYNPHGDMFREQAKPETIQREPGTNKRFVEYQYPAGPKVRLYEDGTQSMTRRDADRRIEQALVSERIAGERISESPNNHWNLPF